MNFSTLKKLGLAAAVASAVLVPYAYANGIFFGYPIVGGASYCDGANVQQQTTTVPGAAYTNSNCSATAPAGPSTLTGNELYPADTNLSNGGVPQTVRVPTYMAASGAYYYNAPLTGATVTVPANVNNVVLNPAAGIAALTIVLPAATALTDGQVLHVGSSGTVAALTLTAGSGTTIAQAPTAITTSVTGAYGFALIYNAANTKWIRLQ